MNVCMCMTHISLFVARRQYRVDAEKTYNCQMIEAFKGRRQFPPIRTFKQSFTSTNSVYHDIEMAEEWYAHQIMSNI